VVALFQMIIDTELCVCHAPNVNLNLYIVVDKFERLCCAEYPILFAFASVHSVTTCRTDNIQKCVLGITTQNGSLNSVKHVP